MILLTKIASKGITICKNNTHKPFQEKKDQKNQMKWANWGLLENESEKVKRTLA
jgi:hypothetical protein